MEMLKVFNTHNEKTNVCITECILCTQVTIGTGHMSALCNSDVYTGVRFVEYCINSASMVQFM